MRSVLFILLLLPLLLSGQGPINGWRSHVSFTPVIHVAETPESIVGATANGIFILNKNSQQITTKTKVEGLSGIGISAIAFAPASNFLLIGYENGNVDLLKNDQIARLTDLTRKPNLPNKIINRIVCEGNFAYLCCGFGVVKIDLQKTEVAETWYLGPNYELKGAYDLATFNDSLWVATDRGIFKAERHHTNLQDYRNWQLQTSLPQPDAGYTSFAQSDGQLFVHDANNDRLLAYAGSVWQQRFPEIRNIRHIKSSASGIIVLTDGEVWLKGKTASTLINSYSPGAGSPGIDPRDALISGDDELWIGDYRYGLTHQTGPSAYAHLVPNSPQSDQVSALKTGPDAIFAATVSSNSNGNPEAAISILQAGVWQNFTAADDAGLKSIQPITDFAFNKEKPDEYWASSAGSGLLNFQKNRVSARYSELNSTLGAVNQSCTVRGIALDAQNNLWYSNPTGKAQLGARLQDGTFVALHYPGMNSSDSPSGGIIVTSSNTHWVILPDQELFAFKIKGSATDISDDQYRKIIVESRFTNGTTTLISQFKEIAALAEDQNHQLWVGTGTGVVVYREPDKIFDPGGFYGYQPSLDDGEGLFKPILEKEKITAIVVDGGNRKWIGTANSGVFLFTGQGDHLLHHFDSKNSPLFSDRVLSIAIDPQSGEVFFATDRGLISYICDATSCATDLKGAYVWPNPLRETYEGGVTIDGLTEGTEIKITDVAGNLVYQTSPVGGRATWNAKNARGVRVSTGVYLIFCCSPLQKIPKIIKLLVIH
jgi:ligand-binding sensor domain-containing protein